MQLIATCAFGLEKLIYDELKKLNLWVIKTEDGRVTFEGDEMAIVRTNLWLRCADRILIKMAEFNATTFDELFDQTFAVDWAKYIDRNDLFPVDATSTKSQLHSEPAIQSIVKKAVVKKMQETYATEIFPENSGTAFPILVKANKDSFLIAINTTGESLHKRGYRQSANEAPIKETLAAAMVMLSDWKPENPLIDPFCGSGTIAIEAAMIAQNIAPGLQRNFLFQKWPWIKHKEILEVYAEVRAAQTPIENLKIYNFDIDVDTLRVAEFNSKRAGFENLHFKRSDVNDLDFSKFENCTFVTNPPYGERLSEQTSVENLYRNFGQKFKETKNCSLFIITSNENFPHFFGRRADKNRKLFNGKIKCYLYQYLKRQS